MFWDTIEDYRNIPSKEMKVTCGSCRYSFGVSRLRFLNGVFAAQLDFVGPYERSNKNLSNGVGRSYLEM